MNSPISIAKWSDLADRKPAYGLVAGVDLVIVRVDDAAAVFFGRCLHRGALLSDGYVDGDNLVCGLHHWDYRLDSGVSEYQNSEVLKKFNAIVELDSDQVIVDESEIAERQRRQIYSRKPATGCSILSV